MRNLTVTLASAGLLLFLAGCGGKTTTPSASPSPPVSSTSVSAPASASSPTAPLTSGEKTDLVTVRGQEQIGADAYRVFADRYNLPFANLATSQTTLVKTVTAMMARFHVPDPMSTAAFGHFTDPALQQRYNTLIRNGSGSASQASTAMQGYETQNMSTLQSISARTSQPDLKRMYGNLRDAANRHLQALRQHSS